MGAGRRLTIQGGQSVKFYLRWVNPAVALAILAICSWIYFGGYFVSFDADPSNYAKGQSIIDPEETSFGMYFFAKGLFCASMLFLFGKFLEKYLDDRK